MDGGVFRQGRLVEEGIYRLSAAAQRAGRTVIVHAADLQVVCILTGPGHTGGTSGAGAAPGGGHGHLVAYLEFGDAGADRLHDAGALVAQHNGEGQAQAPKIHLFGPLRVAQAAADHLHADLIGPGLDDLHIVLPMEILMETVQQTSFHFHNCFLLNAFSVCVVYFVPGTPAG